MNLGVFNDSRFTRQRLRSAIEHDVGPTLNTGLAFCLCAPSAPEEPFSFFVIVDEEFGPSGAFVFTPTVAPTVSAEFQRCVIGFAGDVAWPTEPESYLAVFYVDPHDPCLAATTADES